ncbi:MAG: Coenzyme F420 hydrogenase/dehydrogenase, beta subunit C-terminal domain [Muribaculaceae bacterium]|nr:Coenzyme F420 hydrogenase/dehydrogenase, beta subunit C-terminal domain [Muribaculaceae bacterium]
MIRIPSNCTGCSACISVCPKECIRHSTDAEGFMTPLIDPSECIDCNLCEKVCPALNQNTSNRTMEFLVGQNESYDITRQSSSGGIFYLIGKRVLDMGGVVYGAAFDYNAGVSVKHLRVTDINDLRRILGSKYVQSDINGIFRSVKKDLSEDRQVLFSGTPCQVAGLKRFLRKDYDTLLTVDVICHGVPSPEVFSRYVKEVEKRKSDECGKIFKITHFSFRDKLYGWNSFGVSYQIESSDGSGDSEKIFRGRYEDPYMKGFLYDLYLRESCHDCPVKDFSSGSDITLADAWGIETIMYSPSFDKGFSLAVPHSEAGKECLSAIGVKWQHADLNFMVTNNPAAFKSATPHKKRKTFFRLINDGKSISEAVGICLPEPTFFSRIMWSISKKLKRYAKK